MYNNIKVSAKTLVLISTIALSLTACNQAEVTKAERERDSLQTVVNERDSSLSEVLTSFNDVERNLDSVAVKQHIISMSADKQGELNPTSKERINAQIEGINELMDQNRKKIAELNRKLKSSGNKNAQLLKTIAMLNAQLTQKDEELSDLNAKLALSNVQVNQLQIAVEELTQQNTEQASTIDETTTALHTAYYVIGKTKELVAEKLIDRNGGLLGMGKTSKLSAGLDNSKFTRIDYTTMSSIVVNGKNPKIITTHPAGSYTLDRDSKDKNMVRNIVITDAEKFWSASKYLVVVKD
ncbi:MAG: hypothetical protein ABI763_04080 [Bacteroidota bacterium]